MLSMEARRNPVNQAAAAFFPVGTLVLLLGTVGGLLLHEPASTIVFTLAWDGALLFIMARGLVALARKR